MEATVFCQNCKQIYCKECFTFIHSGKKNKTHTPVPLSEKLKIVESKEV
jgi:hypothetical protein